MSASCIALGKPLSISSNACAFLYTSSISFSNPYVSLPLYALALITDCSICSRLFIISISSKIKLVASVSRIPNHVALYIFLALRLYQTSSLRLANLVRYARESNNCRLLHGYVPLVRYLDTDIS
ncbi:hypothetical protein S103564_2351 [Staphylococcus aureus subsp. aureus 103564]|nr:hypothetical protein S103564_2351 [Staphylococcus aureus subsp. aureus 103564]